MRKKRVNAILVNQTKRRNTVLAFICAIVVSFIFALSFFLIYIERNRDYYVSYDETSDIDYKVYLKDNDFFEEDYLDNGKQYIASLIDYITANFKYQLSLEEKDISYKYSYRIEANVDVKSKGTGHSLYNNTEVLLKEEEMTSNTKEVVIQEDVKIDYNDYNNLIKRFISVYDLEDVDSVLTINLYVNVVGSCEDFEENSEKESVMSLSIPLTTKTMAIDLSNNLINSENNVMQCKKMYSNSFIFVILGGVFGIWGCVLIGLTIQYEIKTRTAENIYERELKKILNNYSSYIQTLHGDFDFKDYQLLKLDTFTDLLEIRDTIRQPILMKENEDKSGAYFVIPSNTKLLYVYRLKVSDIEKEFRKG